MFVDVSPAQATPEPPKKADYYSARNSVAANPDATIQSVIPKIDGKQDLVPKTEDVPREKAFPLRPSPPAAQVQPKPEPAREAKPEPAKEVKPKAAPAPGELAMTRPDPSAPKPRPGPSWPGRSNPRPPWPGRTSPRATARPRPTGQEAAAIERSAS